MAASKKRHMYYDQQKPETEPLEAEQSNLPQRFLAQRSASPEDAYFSDQELDQPHQRGTRKSPTRLHLIDEPEPAQKPAKGFWQRLINALGRGFDTNWRP